MLSRLRRAGWSIQAHFLLYSSALLIPALIFSCLMILRSASLERSIVKSEITGVARNVATAIDGELSATITSLTSLASSPALTDGNLKTFYEQAAAARHYSGIDYFLTSRSGKLLLTTSEPWAAQEEADVKRASPVVAANVVDAPGPVVSDLAPHGPSNGPPAFTISVAVKRGSKAIYVLSAQISSLRINDMLQREQLDRGWVATVIDRKGQVVAQSKDFDAHVGTPWRGGNSIEPSTETGLESIVDTDGEPVLRARHYSQQSGWLISTTVPERIANRPIVHSWALVATLALSFAILSALLAYLFGRRLSDPVRGLVQGARALGRGEIVVPLPSSIIEVRAVGEALSTASHKRQQMEQSLRESEDRLRLALTSAETGAWDWNLKTGTLTWDQRMRELWGLNADDHVSYDVFTAALHSIDREVTAAAIQQALNPDEPGEYDVEYRVKGVRDGVERWIAAKGRTHFVNGKAVRMAGTARDVTESKRWEEHIQLLMREVTHRSKNLLAVIQAMARQTKLASRDVNDFEVRFSGRLQALAASHDLLVQRDWKGASMSEVVKSQLGHYLDQQASQIEIEGPSLVVTPEAAQNIGLAVHELSTNAAKYGALSVPDGRVHVSWIRADDAGDGGGRLRLSWTERGGPDVVRPERRGFGQVVTEHLTARALQGNANLIFEQKGVCWTLDIPDTHVLATHA
jgi:PAS domain S-box-containing protein